MSALIETADNPVRNLVLSVHRSLLRRAMAEAAGAGVLLAGAMALAARLLLPQTGHLDGLLAGAMVGVAFAIVRYISSRPEPLTAALACDQAAKVPELFSTAWSLPSSGGSDPAWQQTILAQACHALVRVDLRAIAHGQTHPGRLIVGLMLLLSAGLWPAQTPPSPTPRQAASLASGRLVPPDARQEAVGAAAWPAATPRTAQDAGETSGAGGPQLLTPADAAASLDPNARKLGEESGGSAMAGRGAGSGLAKGSTPAPIDLPPPGKGTPASAGADLASGDGTASHASGQDQPVSDGQVVADAASARAHGESSANGSSPAPTGPTAREIASTPDAYRAAVREYFNR